MPELPEVETIKTAIEKSIGCCKILNAEVRNRSLRQPIPDDFEKRIVGAKIIGYKRIAKYITVALDNGLSMILHMGMSGKVHLCDRLENPLAKHDHVIIETQNGFLIYNDPRRFGLFTYAKTDELKKNPLLKKTGKDPFDKTLNAQYLKDKLLNKKIPIKVALLDQEIIAGIGNIYASEILFGARISPLRAANQISLEECEKIIKNTREVLRKAIAAGGSTLRDYEKPDGSLGYFQHQHCVYGKNGQKCPVCDCDVCKNGGIQKIIQAGRSTFYCPNKQK